MVYATLAYLWGVEKDVKRTLGSKEEDFGSHPVVTGIKNTVTSSGTADGVVWWSEF